MRAAAGADLDQLDGRDADRQAAALDEALLRARPRSCRRSSGSPPSTSESLAVVPPMSKASTSPPPSRAAEEGGGERAGGRARLEQLHRRALGLRDVGEAAVRQHEQQRRRDARAPATCSRHARRGSCCGQRLDVGVDDRGGGALVLADLGRHLVRGRHRDAGMAPRRCSRAASPLVARVGVGVQEHDRDRASTPLGEPARPRPRARRPRRAARARCRRRSCAPAPPGASWRGTSGSGLTMLRS